MDGLSLAVNVLQLSQDSLASLSLISYHRLPPSFSLTPFFPVLGRDFLDLSVSFVAVAVVAVITFVAVVVVTKTVDVAALEGVVVVVVALRRDADPVELS